MPIETELKARLTDRAGLRTRLESLGARLVEPRALEDNLLLDDAAGGLSARGEALRLRQVRGEAILAWKGPKTMAGSVKSREEIETSCAQALALLDILARLGFKPRFRYQKYRETWELAAVQVMIDETPAGDFVEIEGADEDVRRTALVLGIAPETHVAESYAALFGRLLAGRGDPRREMVFRDAG